MVTVTGTVSEMLVAALVAATWYFPAACPAAYVPDASTVPPVADQVTPTGTVEPVLKKPWAANDRFAPGASDAVAGRMLIATIVGRGATTTTVVAVGFLEISAPWAYNRIGTGAGGRKEAVRGDGAARH